MRRLVFCCCSILLVSLVSIGGNRSAVAQQIDFLEDFALSEDRQQVLEQLVPGTESYYYFHSLHYQHTDQLDKVDALMQPWKKRLGETTRWREIINRQMLLKYSDEPQKTLDYLTKQLNLNFNHQRSIPAADRKLPSKLNASLIDTKKLLAASLKRSGLENVTDQGLRWLPGKRLNKTQRRQLLKRVDSPDFPGLVDLIVAELKERDSQAFGSLAIHRQLTVEQLDELAEKRPRLKTESQFVNIYMGKLRPSEDVNWLVDRKERRKYLDRLRAFVSPLPPTFNSLKANVAYQLLQLNLQEEKYDNELFLEYLKLPRQTTYIDREYLKSVSQRSHLCNLNADFSSHIELPPINNDQRLVIAHLQHFLKSAKDYSKYSQYVRDSFLKQQFATAKILAGTGEVEKWASMLTPEQYQRLLERVDIDFAAGNPEFFQSDEDVSLDLFLKNVDKLIVKVFEVNTRNYYKKFKREIDTDINLDGLTANFEKTYTYDLPPAIRKRNKFEFPQLKERGVYVVDFIAGGKSSRALIRKGRLQLISQVTAAGQAFTVLDSNLAKVADATVWIQGRSYQPEKNGQVVVPFSTQPNSHPAVISHGDFTCLQQVNLVSENYQFKAALVLDRENLLRGNKAKLMIRPSLQVAGAARVPLKLLTDAKLVVTVGNLDGVSVSKTIGDVKLSDDEETICEFSVPPRAKTIQLALSAKIKNISQGKEQSVSAGRTVQVNLIDASDAIQDVHLVPTTAGYFLEVLGKTGEARSAQALRVGLQPDAFKDKVWVDLQSNEDGLVQLGHLANIRSIEVKPSSGQKKSWVLSRQDQTYSNTIHATKEATIELPAPAGILELDSDAVSLLGLRSGTFVADLADLVSVEKGLVSIKPLSVGDYRLRITNPKSPLASIARHDVMIRVTDGKLANGTLVSPNRHLEYQSSQRVQISAIAGNKKTLRVELENASPNARVHVIATRYQPAFDAFASLATVRGPEPSSRVPAVRRSAYQVGRKIGEEYEYILRRKYAAKYPGNMLKRPSLLLNPWAVRETNNDSQDAQSGSDFSAEGLERDSKSNRAAAAKPKSSGNSDFANLDFLGDGSTLIANLKPNKTGVVSIDRKQFADGQHVRVVVIDGFDTVQREINFAALDLEPRDSRLAEVLDPEKHFSQSKQTELLKAGDIVEVDDLVSAKFQVYDDLSDVFTLMQTLSRSPQLAKFRFLLEWEQLDEEKRNELYSKYACHELNFWLMKKDAAFFKTVVLPHLRNKRTKTFVDHYLLGDNLETYASPWQYARLNAVEKILLAQRSKDRSSDLIRNINESYLLNPVARSVSDRRYDTMIRGLGLDVGRQLINANEISKSERRLGQNQYFQSARGKAKDNKKTGVIGQFGRAGGMGGGAGGGGFGGMMGDADSDGLEDMEMMVLNGRAPAMPKNQAASSFAAAGDSSEFAISGKLKRESQPEIRTKMVPVTKLRTENRSRQVTLADGSVVTQNYSVQVPYTENVTQTYIVSGGVAVEQFGLKQDVAMELRDRNRRLYRRLKPTQEWIENNYYMLTPDQQTPALVGVNRFWRDYVNHGKGPFLSPHFADAAGTFTETMFALAVLDLPAKAAENETEFAGEGMTFTAGGPAIVLHQQVRDAVLDIGNTKILVSENFYQKNDRYRFEEGVRYDKFVSDDFLPHVLYGSQVVITNPTSTPRAIELLIQIPEGSIACSGSQSTRTIQLDLAAFSTKTFEYAFYFPAAGEFKHYPAHVSAKEKALAVADGQAFNVVDKEAKVDKESWEFVSQNGTEDQVINFLNRENVQRLDLKKIAFRMKDQDFFAEAIKTLRNRYVYDPTLWSYGIKHDDAQSIREYMSHDNRVSTTLGVEFDCDLVSIDPVRKNWYGHKEYWPLVNARSHQLGPHRKILNPTFASQYQSLLQLLAYRSELDDDDHLVMTYYLLLQDRIEAALQQFGQVSKKSVDSKLQYDYCDAYLDFYRSKPAAAAKKAAKWADYPVDHWRKRFQAILDQADEITAGETKVADADSDSQQQTKLAAGSETIDLEVAAGLATLTYQNVKAVDVNYYEMDIEQLFSRSPFAQDNLDGFSLIRPNQTSRVKLKSDDNGKGSQPISIPKDLANKNVLIEVVADDQTRSQPLFANSLQVGMFENYGQVQVSAAGKKAGRKKAASSSPLSKVYVKVYARMADGSVRFHKDGYTDLRGRFDYASQSNRSADGIQKFSILILSEDNGAVIRQANPPVE